MARELRRRLEAALISAFTIEHLSRLCRTAFDIDIGEISNGNLTEMVGALVDYAIRRNAAGTLVVGALRENPTNLQLQSLASDIMDGFTADAAEPIGAPGANMPTDSQIDILRIEAKLDRVLERLSTMDQRLVTVEQKTQRTPINWTMVVFGLMAAALVVVFMLSSSLR